MQSQCRKCKTFQENGMKAEFMAYDEGTLLFSHYEGAATVSKKELHNFVPFSVWICEDCIKKEQKKPVYILLFLVLFLLSLIGIAVGPQEMRFFIGVFSVLFFSGVIYCIVLFFKPYRKIKEDDLSFMFTDIVTSVREKTGRSKHMLLSEYYSQVNNHDQNGYVQPRQVSSPKNNLPRNKKNENETANHSFDYDNNEKIAELINLLMKENPDWSSEFAEETARTMIKSGYRF